MFGQRKYLQSCVTRRFETVTQVIQSTAPVAYLR